MRHVVSLFKVQGRDGSFDFRSFPGLPRIRKEEGSMLLDAKEAARRLGITERTLNNWVRGGRLEKVTDERGNPRYRAEEVARLLGQDSSQSSQPLERDEWDPGRDPSGAAALAAAPSTQPDEMREAAGISEIAAELVSANQELAVLRSVLEEVRSDRDFLREELRRRHDEQLHSTRELIAAKLEVTELKGELKAQEERAALPWWRRLFRPKP